MCGLLEVHMGNTKTVLSKPKRYRCCTRKNKLSGQAETLLTSSQYRASVCGMCVLLEVDMGNTKTV